MKSYNPETNNEISMFPLTVASVLVPNFWLLSHKAYTGARSHTDTHTHTHAYIQQFLFAIICTNYAEIYSFYWSIHRFIHTQDNTLSSNQLYYPVQEQYKTIRELLNVTSGRHNFCCFSRYPENHVLHPLNINEYSKKNIKI